MIVFRTREDAGRTLAERLLVLDLHLSEPIVLCVPRGGVPVGFHIARALNASLDVVVLRKIPIPYNLEAGFGAVTLDRTVVLNKDLLQQLHLTKQQIQGAIDSVYEEVIRRNEVYRNGAAFPALEGRSVILADDGLASGFTMLAAIAFSRRREPKEIIVTCPVAHRDAYQLVAVEADRVIVLHVSNMPYFAVASFYEEFPEMNDSEVVDYLSSRRTERGEWTLWARPGGSHEVKDAA